MANYKIKPTLNGEGGGGTTYTAGENITIENNVISATDTTYTAGTNVSISSDNVISATDTTYTAGTGIEIENGVIKNTQDEVTANPTLEGTEPDLTGLQVGNSKYKVSAGGGSSSDLAGLYPNSRIAELVNKLVGDSDDTAYIKLSDLQALLNAKTNLSNIPVSGNYGKDILSIELNVPYYQVGSSENKLILTNGKIKLDFHEDSGSYLVVITVEDGTEYGNTIFNDTYYLELTSIPDNYNWDAVINDLIDEEGDKDIYLSSTDSGSLLYFTNGTEFAVSQPFLFGLTILVTDESSQDTAPTYYGRLDLDDFIDNIQINS